MGRGGRGKKGNKSKSKAKPAPKKKKTVVTTGKGMGPRGKLGPKGTVTKAQQMAKNRIAAKKATTSTTSAGKTSGIGPVKSGKQYASMVSKAKNQPTKKTKGIGPYADGAKYAAALKANPPVTAKKFNEAPTKTAFNPLKLLRNDPNVDIPAGAGNTIPSATKRELQIHNFERQLEGLPPVKKLPDQSSIGVSDSLAAAGNLGGLGTGTAAPSYFNIKSPETFGAPSQDAVDAAAGITAGGLNIGGSGFTPDKPSGSSTSRAISDGASKVSFGPVADGNEYAKNITDFGMKFGATPEARGKAYEQSLDPNSFKGLSDGMTFGVGPVASGDAYARGLNTDNKNVENRLRQVRNLGSTLTGGLIPSVRKLTDKEIADRRIKNAAFREANLVGRKRGSSGGARLPVAPLTPEEIIEEAAVAQTVPDYQQAQTGVDPNRLMQIQQEAYLQAFNPTYNPMFRFFDRRRGARRGAFRKAFRRD